RSRRDLWFVVIGAVAILATPRRPGEAAADRFVLTRWRALLVGIMTGLVLAVTGWARGLSERRLEEKVGERFPAEAAAVIERRNCPGPLYNHFNWGGYLLWALPRRPVTIDGRGNVHGDERTLRSLDTWAGKPGWDSDPDLANARLVVSDTRSPLAALLRLD